MQKKSSPLVDWLQFAFAIFIGNKYVPNFLLYLMSYVDFISIYIIIFSRAEYIDRRVSNVNSMVGYDSSYKSKLYFTWFELHNLVMPVLTYLIITQN